MVFKTLNSKIQSDLNESIYINKFYLEKKWNFIEGKIVQWSRKPIKQSIIFTLFFAFIFMVISNLYLLENIIPSVKFFSWDLSRLTTFQDLIFNGQLTILALIFPLVIGFVGILIKDDIANKSLWKIYSRYSGFMLVGFSALALIISISLLNYLNTEFNTDNIKIALVFTFILWFIFNLLLVGWLLYSTFSFIQIERQNTILIKYTTNVVVLAEIKKRLYSLIPLNAIAYKLIPENDDKSKQKISLYKFDEEYDDLVVKEFKRAVYLKNINYTLLHLTINFWKFRNRNLSTTNDLELFLPIRGTSYPNKKYNLAYLNNDKFTWLEKILIKYSYSFTNKDIYEDVDVENIVNVLFNNIDNAIGKNNKRVFSNSVKDLKTFMQDIFAITTFNDDNNQVDNWLLLPDGSIFSSKLLDEFMKEYYSLNELIIDKAINTDYYFREFCYFYQYAFPSEPEIHTEIKKSLLKAHYYFWVSLIKNDILKSKPYFDGLCKKYIGGWESWSKRVYNEVNSWNDAKKSAIISTSHMNFSCMQIIVSLRYENKNASIWATNILNSWLKSFRLDRSIYQFSWKRILFNSSVFLYNENSDFIKYITNNNLNIDDFYVKALSNNHTQSVIITAAYILKKNVNDLSDIDRQIIFALLNADKVTPGTTPVMSFKRFNISHILETYILNSFTFKENSNKRIADDLINNFNSIYGEEYISGRIYSGFIENDISYVKDSFFALLISNSNNIFRLSPDFIDLIFSDILSQQNIDELIRLLNNFTNIEEDVQEKVKKLLEIEDINNLMDNYQNSINSIVEEIERKNNERILNTPINESQVNKIKTYCSNSVFKPDNFDNALNLFNNVNYSSTLSNDFKQVIRISSVDKRQFINEDLYTEHYETFYADILQDYVSKNLFRKIVSDINYINQEFTNRAILVLEVLKDALNKDNMLIFIGSNDVLEYLNSFFYSSSNRDLPFDIRKEDGFGNYYICHINNIPVYSLRNYCSNCCLLLDKNVFEVINIKRFSKDIYVDAEYYENQNDLTDGTLEISYGIQMNLNNEIESYKYILNNDESE